MRNFYIANVTERTSPFSGLMPNGGALMIQATNGATVATLMDRPVAARWFSRRFQDNLDGFVANVPLRPGRLYVEVGVR